MSGSPMDTPEVRSALALLAAAALPEKELREQLKPPRKRKVAHNNPMLPANLSDLRCCSGVLLLVVRDDDGLRQVDCRGGRDDEVTRERWDSLMLSLRESAQAHVAAGCRSARVYHVYERLSSRISLLVAEYEK